MTYPISLSGGRRFIIMLLIQILITNVSGQTLDDGKTMGHARAKNASRNTQNNQTQSNQMSPRAICLSQKTHAAKSQHQRCENSASKPVQPQR
ncbi:MAG: hypothetical protein HY298_00210 [Verrucomicrobia bacterium]|nr:hypothetical protein [Verrucomicrobiota bacterium]